MSHIPTLTTERLALRPFALSDAPTVQKLAGARDVAMMTTTIPHPYEDGIAEAWIETHQDAFDQGEEVVFAVTRSCDGLLIGAIGISINKLHQLGEMGYWIGKPYWGQGYCTEAARAVVRYAFDVLHLNRVQARHMTKNPASGRVMQKAGMRYEGTLRQSLHRWDAFEDAAVYAILRSECMEEASLRQTISYGTG
jgi:[ribosomal protein S5]-alanine N-acetyltransferase